MVPPTTKEVKHIKIPVSLAGIKLNKSSTFAGKKTNKLIFFI